MQAYTGRNITSTGSQLQPTFVGRESCGPSSDTREQHQHVLAASTVLHHDHGGDIVQCVHHGVLLHSGQAINCIFLFHHYTSLVFLY